MTFGELEEFGKIYHHKFLVMRFLNIAIHDLINRAEDHDSSKFEEDEFPKLVAITEEFKPHPFGTPENAALREKYKDVFAIHQKKERNRHHPEHYPNGIEDMTLMDVLEMLCDWKAATLKQHEAGNSIEKSIEMMAEKYKISPQLVKILVNTARSCNM